MTFALLFHGGLIPTYIVVTQWLDLGNTIWVLILTMLVSPWNVFLMRSFMSGIPTELLEAAFIDGAGEFPCRLMFIGRNTFLPGALLSPFRQALSASKHFLRWSFGSWD